MVLHLVSFVPQSTLEYHAGKGKKSFHTTDIILILAAWNGYKYMWPRMTKETKIIYVLHLYVSL